MSVSHGAKAPTLRDRAAQDAKHIAEEVGKIQIVDFCFGVAMMILAVSVAGLPFGTLATAGLVLVASRRPAKYENPTIGAFSSLMALAVFYAMIMSVTFGTTTNGQIIRRVVRIAIVIGLVVVIANRKVDFRSMILGIATGLLLNVPVFYAGLNSHAYGSYLTGWIGDKNQSGLWYAAVGVLVVMSLQKRLHRILAIIIFLLLVYLTGSRTSTAALIFGLLWLIVAKYLNIIMKIGLGAFIIWAVDWLTQNLAQNEAFGDRTGTDALRQRIDDAAWEKIQIHPWTGLGLGSATVNIQDLTFFFHNSFWTLMVEAGWFYMLAIVGITLWAVFFVKQPLQKAVSITSAYEPANTVSSRNVLGEAAMILLFICSWRLGEVFLTVPWGMAVGLALSYLAVPKNTNRASY